MQATCEMHRKHLKCLGPANYLLLLETILLISDTAFPDPLFKVIFVLFLLFPTKYWVSFKGLSLIPSASAGCAFSGEISATLSCHHRLKKTPTCVSLALTCLSLTTPLRYLMTSSGGPLGDLSHVHHILSETCFFHSVSSNPEGSKPYSHLVPIRFPPHTPNQL